ncbi:TDO2 [Mytilus coruscus]|uniref:TDO2 n=1 Tax=Mytilus coruscus TaxID=42192 RepID=A0A6J8DIC2_MYTCO|nr:TDO2 [Mytilus coruscus]
MKPLINKFRSEHIAIAEQGMDGASQTTAGGNASVGTLEHEKAKSYENYLQLNKVLDGVRRLSVVNGDPAHDEHLFIVIHQAFELWFKQMLFDMESVIEIFDSSPAREEKQMLIITQRLERVVLIWKLLIDQFFILETMPPLNFLEFRHHLGSASGFQSLQFRLLENKFGIREEDRIKYDTKPYYDKLDLESSRIAVRKSAMEKTLFSVVQTWLEGMDEIDSEFWQRYVKAVENSTDKASFQCVVDKSMYESKIDILKLRKNITFKFKASNLYTI